MSSSQPTGARWWQIVAGASGGIGVVFGALGAHVAPSLDLARLVETASFYQLLHAAVLLWLGTGGGWWRGLARWLFAVATVLFCGGLYLKALTGWAEATRLAPVGGTAFILGWVLIAVDGVRPRPG